MLLVDTHCHLDDEKFDDDREAAYGRAMDAGVDFLVDVGSDLSSSRAALEFAQTHARAYAACGVHPHEAKDAPQDYLEQLEGLLKQDKVVALGEIGLDYYYDYSPRETQKHVMLEQMALALRVDKPAIFHIRDAHGDMAALFAAQKKLPRGVIHCFSGSAQMAQQYVKWGFYISFAGPLTFKKAPQLCAAAQSVPMDRLLIETDSPYLSPEPLRGRRNEPKNVQFVCEKLAQLKGVSAEEMAWVTHQNARAIYGV